MQATIAPRQAGRTTQVADEGTATCLTIKERPTTPEEIRKYRKSYFADAGVRVVHPGLIDDVKKIDPNTKYGSHTADSEHVEHVFGHGPQTDFEEYQNAKQEACYHSRQREPLGKSYNRGHVLPDEAKSSVFSFGIATGSSESAKNLLYPRKGEDESKFREAYIKSHGSFAPGEQRVRGYEWDKTGMDPTVHRFGKVEKNGLRNGVGLSMNPEKDDCVSKTRITAKQVEDMKNLKDHLGRAKNLGHGNRGLQEQHVFGVKGTLDQWDAQACIAGDYSYEEQMPDPDLGTSATVGWRNTTTDVRSFGCPTVRADIPQPERKSVSDNQNYGDDVNAQFLLYPPQFAYGGVEDEDFIQQRDAGDIREIFENIGYKLSDAQFRNVWAAAAANHDYNGDGIVSVEEFRAALNEAEDNGQL
jgi:hypothetical protein